MEEIREQVLEHCRSQVEYWSRMVPEDTTLEERLGGAVFCVLSMRDGSCVQLPGFKVIPNNCPGDYQYYRSRGENWYNAKHDIAGSLHELFYRHDEEPSEAGRPEGEPPTDEAEASPGS